MWRCEDCGGLGEGYMVRQYVWREAVPPAEQHKTPCLNCLQHRLGRQVMPDDFDFSLVINQGICAGLQMGRREAQAHTARAILAQRNEDRKRGARRKKRP